MLYTFQSEALVHPKNITSSTLEVAQPAPVPSPEDETFETSPQFTPADVEENWKVQLISTSNRHHKNTKNTSLPSTRSLQKLKSELCVSKAKLKASGLPKKKHLDPNPECGTSVTQKNKCTDQSSKPGLQDDNQHEVRHQKEEINEVQ